MAITVPASAATKPSVSRTYGSDRYATAVAIAKSGYSHGAPVVFLASGANFPDALSAGPAAAKLGGPLLLTQPGSLPSNVATELKSLKPTKVYVAGGPDAVKASVLTAAKRAVPAATITRLSGSDRYATARAVISKAFTTAPKAYLATGTGFADALSAAAAAGSAGDPVVLVHGTAKSLDSATLATLSRLKVSNIMIAGGSDAISSGIYSQLYARYGASHVVREGGADRYATSALIGKSQFKSASTAYFASGAQFPDALSASAVAGPHHAPLFTVQPGCVPSETASAVSQLGVSHVVLVGGPNALSSNVAALGTCSSGSAGHTIQNTSSTYAIQSSMTLTGSGQGFHAKIELVTASAAVTFGIQYDAKAAAPYTGKPAFLIENISNASGESGNSYGHTGAASVGKAYQVLLTLQSNGSGTVYVNGKQVGTFTNKNLANKTVYARVQAVGKQDGDRADASFANTLVKEKGSVHSAQTSAVYPNHFTTNTAVGKTTNPITISGTVSGFSGTWSTANPEGVTVQFQ
ncbi:cell wall-binding repeat-containing protein [Gryllotalpicola reticulitermitis]|uniref:cell wall-binding repeat-containing protein n=1 Tax=Gryllotalpicola reticulitermitis TaxID=1184153 RepID=UPI0036F41768